jgi:hypothetical protein
MRKVLRRIGKLFLWLLVILGLILLTVFVSLQFESVQRILIEKGQSYFNEKTGGELTISDIDLDFPFELEIFGLSLNDPQSENVVRFEALRVNLNLHPLLNQSIVLDKILLEEAKILLSADSTGTWNYEFILDGFASGEANKQVDKTESSWDFIIGDVGLREIQFDYIDGSTKDSLNIHFEDLRIGFESFSVIGNRYAAETIVLDELHGHYKMGFHEDTVDSLGTEENTVLPELGSPEITIRGSEFEYAEQATEASYKVDIGYLFLETSELDIDSGKYGIKKLNSERILADIQLGKTEESNPSSPSYFLPLEILGKQIDLKSTSVNLSFHESVEKQFIRIPRFKVKDLVADSQQYELDIQDIALSYNEYPELSSFRTQVHLDSTSASLREIEIQSGQSEIKGAISAEFDDLSTFIEKLSYKSFEINLESFIHRETSAGLAQEFLDPEIQPLLPHDDLFAAIGIKGNQTSILIEELKLRTGNTLIGLTGAYMGRDPLENGTFKLDTLQASISKADWLVQLDSLGVDSEMIPEKIALLTKAVLSEDSLNSKITINTNMGSLNASINGDGYKSDIFGCTGSLELNKIYIPFSESNTDDLAFDLDGTFEIVNLRDSALTGNTKINFDSLSYGDYSLQNVSISSNFYPDTLGYQAEISDTFLVASLNGGLRYGSEIIASLNTKVEGIDFQGIGLLSDDIRGQFLINGAYYSNEQIDEVELLIGDMIFIREGERYDIEPIQASYISSPDTSLIAVNSSFATLNSNANVGADSLQHALRRALIANDQVDVLWNASFEVTELESIQELFIPSLTAFEPATGSLNLDGNSGLFDAKINVPQVHFGVYQIDSLSIISNTKSNSIKTDLSVQRASYGELSINNSNLRTSTSDTSLVVEFLVDNDSNEVAEYFLQGSFGIDYMDNQEGYFFSLADSLMLNAKRWHSDSSNRIRVFPEGIALENFGLWQGEDSLALEKEFGATTTSLKAHHFELEALTQMISYDVPIASGIAFGNIDFNQDGSFDGTGRIDEFALLGSDLGLFEWSAAKESSAYLIEIQTAGENAKFDLSGSIEPIANSTSKVNIDLDIAELPMEILKRAFPENLFQAEGYAYGKIGITGNTDAPQIQGNLRFNESNFGLISNGMIYQISDKSVINIQPRELKLSSFQIIDEQGKPLNITGEIRHNNFENSKINLSISGNDFQLIDSDKDSGELFYGKLFADIKINVQGDLLSPSVNSEIAVLEETTLTVIVPEDNEVEGFDENLLVWKDFDEEEPSQNILTREKESTNTSTNPLANTINLKGSLRIEENAKLQIIMDTLTGDFLEIVGGGVLGISYDRAGNLRLSGTYTVKDGFYQMRFYDIAKRRFNIEKGSNIVWNGGPMDASLNITALYKTKANLVALMTSEGGGVNPAYQQQLPFEVVMGIKGEIEKPEISFDLRLEESAKGALNGAVDARLNQISKNENELNKQVFALLVLNTFISTNSEANPNLIANTTRNSASQILSQQLNNLSGKVVKGVDLNFDLESYGGAAGQGNTDLNIDVAKSFLDDRMIVRVGSTIALESNIETANSQDFMTNIDIEYKLTEDGRYRLKAYSKTDLEDIVVGRITRTGAGFVFQKDFDRFNNIFAPNESLKLNKDSTEVEQSE